ncbi:MAG: MFS transporter [Clostridia bacterium]|nr:MFS transporter [Clostridia bacterium]
MFNLLLALIYICFISLGLPDSLLGSAWPVMHQEISAPVSYAGIVSMVISVGTIVSSLLSDRAVRKFGTGKITAISVTLTAVALFGFSTADRFWMLILWAIPYGIGGGGVDAVLNNYVALHYKAQHMSWLHCFWGVGACISPYIMSFSLVKLDSWNYGYLIVSIIQIVLSLFIFMSLPLWKEKKNTDADDGDKENESHIKIREIVSIPGAVPCFLTFFGYCALELTTSLWASSYLVQDRGLSPETASAFASLFYIGITAGRAINGFLAMKFNDRFLIRLGLGIICVGILLVLIPINQIFALIGFVVIGLGCAPVYPCIIHMTPALFGKDKSQAMIGIQMACAYSGFCLVPPLFGVIANNITISLLPAFLMILLVLIAVMHEIAVYKTKNKTM